MIVLKRIFTDKWPNFEIKYFKRICLTLLFNAFRRVMLL